MSDRHTTPARIYRPDPDLYARAQAAVAEVGGTMNGHLTDFLRWVAGDTDQLPLRPRGNSVTRNDTRKIT